MPLPFFLEPLLLVAHHQQRLVRYISGWFRRSNEQLFGPLEQMVAAIVILGLAMQTPPTLWAPPQFPPIIFNDTGIPQLQSPPSLSASSQSESSEISTGNSLLDKAYKYLPEWLQFSPVNIAFLLMCMNVGILMIGDDLKSRLKESWDIFWPPWQDRKLPSSSSQAKSRSLEASATSLDRKSESEKAREVKSDTSKQPTSAIGSKELVAGDTSGPKVDEKETEKEKLTESEKARNLKDLDEKKASQPENTDPKDKGKGRMEGERPNDTKPSSKSTSEPTKAGTTSRDIKTSKADPKAKDDKMVNFTHSDEKTSSKSSNGSDTEPDPDLENDPLMAGDYKPLKSSLKKAKKKPKQSKNIHHNFFMTMRGYKPSLIPFPRGFHPKPHEPRNTLWWDNIPRNTDHVMASPKVLKDPESDEKKDKKDEKDGEKEDKKDGKKDKKDDKAKDETKDKDKDKDKDKEKEKEKEKAKAKAEAEAKAKAAKAKEATGSSSSQPAASPKVPIDPKIQKATYICQALLCTLLYYMNPQLGFLLLTFFVWQFINEHNEIVLSRQAVNPSATSSSSTSSSRERSAGTDSTSRSTDSQGTAKAEDNNNKDKGTTTRSDVTKRIDELDQYIKKIKATPELTSENKDKLQRATAKRDQLTKDLEAISKKEKPAESQTTPVKDRDTAQDRQHAGPKALSVEELEKQAKAMDEYVSKARSIENPTEEQKAKLIKAEEKRRALWKQVRTMKGNEPASFMPSEPKADKVNPDDKEEKIKERIHELENYVMRYRKIENPSDEQQEKLKRVELQRRELKKDLLGLEQKLNVGRSGLSVDEKASLVSQE